MGQLVRLGLQYTIQDGYTLIGVALKFGVSGAPRPPAPACVVLVLCPLELLAWVFEMFP